MCELVCGGIFESGFFARSQKRQALACPEVREMSLLDLKFANFSEIRQDEVRNFCLQSIILLRTTAPTDLTLWLLHRSTLHDNNFPAYPVYVFVPPSIAF